LVTRSRHFAAMTLKSAAGRVFRGRLLAPCLLIVGLGMGGVGTVLGLAAVSPVSAAGSLRICSASIRVMPGDGGTCTETIRDSADPRYGGPVDVSIVISTVSNSGGGPAVFDQAGTASGSGPVGTEALLDGQPTGLQVARVADRNHVYELGPISCYSGPPPAPSATYPDASYCQSQSTRQLVAVNVDNATFSDAITIFWSFPISAGNVYQGGSASITIVPTFTASTGPVGPPAGHTPTPSPTGAVKGASTTSPPAPPSPGGHQRVLGASAPNTGAQLSVVLSRALIVAGLALVLIGLWVRRRRRYFSSS
jgi:hypothetical protein